MTMLVSKYKIEIKQEPRFTGETFEERYARITASEHGITTMYVMSTLPQPPNKCAFQSCSRAFGI
jgi:hypothetical protein